MTAHPSSPSSRLLAALLEHSLLLPLGAVTGLVAANVAPGAYGALAHALEFIVNDVGMAFFFALAAKEVLEATRPGGSLASARRAAVPLAAAVGGMVVPALLYVAGAAWLQRPDLMRGWAIPCATDIAFSYLVARVIFGVRHAAVPFLLLLAIADDALGLAILALFYPQGEIHGARLALLLGAAMIAAWWLRQRGTASFWPYLLIAGSASWLGLYLGGFHPALALVPIVPWMPSASAPAEPATLERFEHQLHAPVQAMLFFFGLVNAGVPVAAVGTGTWLVLVAILVGKPLGIVLATAAAALVGLRRPAEIAWLDVVVVGYAAGIGFTVALFFATAAFPAGALLAEAKMGALLSIGAALPALLLGAMRRRRRAPGS